jgi:hypothetical protein
MFVEHIEGMGNSHNFCFFLQAALRQQVFPLEECQRRYQTQFYKFEQIVPVCYFGTKHTHSERDRQQEKHLERGERKGRKEESESKEKERVRERPLFAFTNFWHNGHPFAVSLK